jgi:hypothetical protein
MLTKVRVRAGLGVRLEGIGTCEPPSKTHNHLKILIFSFCSYGSVVLVTDLAISNGVDNPRSSIANSVSEPASEGQLDRCELPADRQSIAASQNARC